MEQEITIRPVKKFGTRELSDNSFNTMSGCSNDCRYCYAAHAALEKGYLKSRADWKRERAFLGLDIKNVKRGAGTVMYPTRHDIKPYDMRLVLYAIHELLSTDNDILICTKAHLSCIEDICRAYSDHRDRISFMITVTSLDERLCSFWEPGAPTPVERIAALRHAFENSFCTNVICEPMLQGPGGAIDVYNAVEDYVTNNIWFGKMVFPEKRVDMSQPGNADAVAEILRLQSDSNIKLLHSQLNGLPKVCWKGSISRLIEKMHKDDERFELMQCGGVHEEDVIAEPQGEFR